MAKKATPAKPSKRPAAKPKTKATARKPARAAGADRRKKSGRRSGDMGAADALFKLIESPLVADLLAVGATAALAAIADRGLKRKGGDGATSGRALKAAAKAAAAAMGRQLSTEVGQIRNASKKPKEPAKG